MIAGPGHELRASHADRERVIGTLKAAFVQGMLSKDEFDQRVGQAFGSRVRAELAALTTDLHVEPIDPEPMDLEPVAAHGEQAMLRPGRQLAVATGLYASIWAFAAIPSWPLNSEGDPPRAIILLVFTATLIYLAFSAVAVGNLIADRIQKRSATNGQ